MTWIDKKEDWFGGRRNGGKPAEPRPKAERPEQRLYTVSEVADIFRVSRQTVFKWLSIDEPEGAVIPVEGWYRMSNGYIRIKEWVVVMLKCPPGEQG